MADRARPLQDRAALGCVNFADRGRPLQDRAALGYVDLADRARPLEDQADLGCFNLVDRARPLTDRAALDCVTLADRARSLKDRAALEEGISFFAAFAGPTFVGHIAFSGFAASQLYGIFWLVNKEVVRSSRGLEILPSY